jgi:Bacterial Ig-like domain (group 3)/FG-GAP-like repeat
MTHSDLASFLSRTFLRQATFRAFILPAMVALSAVFTTPQAWATAAPTTTALTITSGGSDVTSVVSGTAVTLTATVVSGSTQVNPGQVKFCDASAKYCEDSALLATAQLTTAGTATFKFRPGIGSHSYQAAFVGTHSYAKSTSSTPDLTVTGLYPTATTITSSGSSGNYALTATVVGTGSRTLYPTGEVSFLDTTSNNASLGTAALETATSGQSFTIGPTFGAGNYPTSIAVSDFNGDGIPDLAIADNGTFPGSVTVLLGNGDGTFATKSTPSVGYDPFAIAAGDFNGDGIIDLAVVGYGDDSLTVLLGNGDGTFTTKSTLTVGVQPSDIAVGDFNGDGIPDLMVANEGDNTVTLLMGDGDETFATTSSPGVGVSPKSIVVGDFNEDGILDLATANCGTICTGAGQGPSTVTVLLGKGDGTFKAQSIGLPNTLPFSIVAGDFNGDGIPDLACDLGNDYQVAILLNQITTTSSATLSSTLMPDNKTHLIAAGYSGDDTFGGSTSGTVALSTTQVATTLSLSSSSNPSNAFPITLTATLTPSTSGSLTTAGEAVTFYNGGIIIGTAALSSGVATLNTTSLPAGTDTLTAIYPGDANFSAATSNSIMQVVQPFATTPVFNLPSGTYPSATVTISDTTPEQRFSTRRTAIRDGPSTRRRSC